MPLCGIYIVQVMHRPHAGKTAKCQVNHLNDGPHKMTTQIRDRISLGLGLIGLVGFLYLYVVKLFGQHGRPPTSAILENLVGRPRIVMINVLIFACFLAILPYRRPSGGRN